MRLVFAEMGQHQYVVGGPRNRKVVGFKAVTKTGAD